MASQTKSVKYALTLELTAEQLQQHKDLIEQSQFYELKEQLKSAKIELIASDSTANNKSSSPTPHKASSIADNQASNTISNKASSSASNKNLNSATKARTPKTESEIVPELDTRPCVSDAVIETMKELQKAKNQHLLMWCLTAIQQAGCRIDASNFNFLRSLWRGYTDSQVLVDEDCPLYSEYDYKQLILDVGGSALKANILKRKIINSDSPSILASCDWPQTENGKLDWAKMFSLGTFDDKRQLFISLRWINPFIARNLLQKNWNEFSSSEQNTLLQLLAINLSTGDEEFLTQLLQSEKQVRNNVLKLLRRMPDSEYSRKCGQALKENLRYDPKSDKWVLSSFNFKEQYAALGAKVQDGQLDDKGRADLLYFWLQGTNWSSLLGLIEPYCSAKTNIAAIKAECFKKLFDIQDLLNVKIEYSMSDVIIGSLARSQSSDADSYHLFLDQNGDLLDNYDVPHLNALLPYFKKTRKFNAMPSTLGRLEMCFVPLAPAYKIREFLPAPNCIAENFPEYINQLIENYQNGIEDERPISHMFFAQPGNEVTLARIKDLADLALLYIPYNLQVEFFADDDDTFYDFETEKDFDFFTRLLPSCRKLFSKANHYLELKRTVGTELQKIAQKSASTN